MRRKPKLTGRKWIRSEHQSWGDNISYLRREGKQHRWCGWTSRRPEVGDLIVTPTSDGLAEFVITEVRGCIDPPDMWFASTSHKGRLLAGADK